jgi:hypothetical protein
MEGEIMYKIEKNIPIPNGRSKSETYPFRQMKVGDSFIVKDKGYHQIHSAVNQAKMRGIGKYRTQIQPDKSVRVWRIE